ncbi:MAG: DUF4139 domain-containing protein [Flavobacteriales bacterium]|nr:DUF4139 domain-containing protein [Flavobacteriales bacterium]
MKYLWLFVLCVAGPGLAAQQSSDVESNIEEVTVFLSGAQINRTANVSLKAGENIVRLKGLAEYLDPNSIQVEGDERYVIQGVKHEVNVFRETTLPPEVKAKKDSLETLEFTLQMRAAMRKVYNEEREMLTANRSVKGTNATLLVEDLEEMADFYRNRTKEIEYKLLEIDRDQKQLNEDINRIRQYLNQRNAMANKRTSEILVTVLSNKQQSVDIDFSYMVRQAGWVPTYDIRAKDIKSNLELIYKGKVYQSTGIDWDRVKLTLSTGNPTIGGQAPTMQPWYLYLAEVYNGRKAKGEYGLVMAAEEADFEPNFEVMADSMDAEGRGFSSWSDVVTVNQNQINTEFAIAIPYVIPSDGQYHEVETQRYSLSADFHYFSVPKLDQDAFLVADVTDWEKYNLLPGQSNIYFQGTFVGKAFIDPAITSDTLNLSMGRDQSVVVERKQVSEYCKTTMLGGKKKTTKAFEIKVHNTKNTAVKITIEDQIPLTQSGDIEVEVEETSGARYDAATGQLLWDMDIAAGETKSVMVRFSVKYPKKRVIGNL